MAKVEGLEEREPVGHRVVEVTPAADPTTGKTGWESPPVVWDESKPVLRIDRGES